MKYLIQKFLPKKNHFMGVDIGAHHIKVAEIKVIDGLPEVTSLKLQPSPPDVWTESLDEEGLVLILKKIVNPQLKEVITCIGGEKVISRIVRLPQMNEKELLSTAKFEITKFVPTPVDQLIVRVVRLEESNGGRGKQPKIKIFIPRKGETKEINGGQQEGQNVLLLAVPIESIYRYYSIFSRAGLVVTAIDLKSFALWRVFGRNAQGIVAIADVGEKTSHLVVVKDGIINFIRLLVTGSDALTKFIMKTYGIGAEEAQQMKNEAAISVEGSEFSPPGMYINDILNEDLLREGLQEITKELHRSLSFYSNQENISIEKLIISGGASKMKGLTGFLEDVLDMPVEIGVPDVHFAGGVAYDPVFSVAIGLALREVT